MGTGIWDFGMRVIGGSGRGRGRNGSSKEETITNGALMTMAAMVALLASPDRNLLLRSNHFLVFLFFR